MAVSRWNKTIQPIRSTLNRVSKLDRRGNVLMMTAFALIPLTMSVGAAVDYSRAARLQTKLNAAADAAALAAVTQPMMAKNDDAAKAAAIAMFNSQVAGISGLIYDPANLSVTITQTGVTSTSRNAVVSYTAQSINSFGTVLGMTTVPIGGRAKSTATRAPNIDFYLALDTSPSMALPTTTGGFNLIDAAAQCSFACHSNKIQNYVGPTSSLKSLVLDTGKYDIVKGYYGTSGSGQDEITKIDDQDTYIYTARKATDTKCTQAGVTIPITTYDSNGKATTKNELKDLCIYNKDGSYVDTYWWAQNRGIRLRVTDERAAAINLMSIAANYAAENNSTYRAALYTFDHDQSFKTIATLTSSLSSVASAAADVDLAMVNDKQGNGCPMTGCGGNNYWFTSFKSLMTNMLTNLPSASGNGTNNAGDTPQAFLFIVTDGMSDENIGSGRTRAQMQDQQIAQCKSIKDRGIQIAILYTEYTAASIADDEVGQRTIVTNNIPKVAPALIKCASPGLMYTVRTDEDISSALQALFTRAVSTARLLQ